MGLRPQRDLLEAAAPKRVLQRVLVITADTNLPSFLAAKSALDRIGIPYLVVSPTTIPELFHTESGTNVCNFNSVLFSYGGIVSNETERARIASFEIACGAREAVWYAWPSPEFGLQYIDQTASSAYTATVDNSAAAQAFFSRVKPTAQIPVSGAYTYPTSVLDAVTTPLLRNDKGVILALHKTTDGRDVLVSTFDGNPYQTHELAVEYDMLRWLTKGMFVGKKRSYLSAQIDDIFLDNFMWNPTLNTTVEDETSSAARTFRMSGSDMTAFVAWQSALQASLPAGSSFITEMAFNGVGATSSTDALLVASRNAGSKLTWLNHTWDHENLDASSRSFTSREVQRNCKRASDLRLAGFTCAELVTPDMSGLTNSKAVLGMLDAGVKWVVSDTSHTTSNFPSAPGDNPSFNVGRYNALDARLYQIPRHPTSVFYNVETPDLHTDEYRFLYDGFWAANGFGGTIDYTFVQDKASDFGFLYLLQGDIDPLMFHQANLHNYAAPAGNHSLYGDFIDATVAKYVALSSAPILSLSQDAIGKAMIERDKLNKCGATATITESSTGARTLILKATAACTIPVTGLNKSGYGKVETYNGEKTTSVALSAGQTITIPL